MVLGNRLEERGLIQAMGLETYPASKFTPFFFLNLSYEQINKLSVSPGPPLFNIIIIDNIYKYKSKGRQGRDSAEPMLQCYNAGMFEIEAEPKSNSLSF